MEPNDDKATPFSQYSDHRSNATVSDGTQLGHCIEVWLLTYISSLQNSNRLTPFREILQDEKLDG